MSKKDVGCVGYLCYPFPETNCIIKDCIVLVKNLFLLVTRTGFEPMLTA